MFETVFGYRSGVRMHNDQEFRAEHYRCIHELFVSTDMS